MKEELPLVSVIIPTFNSGRTIDLALQSIINQTYRNIEIVVVDGGSVDNTLELLQKYKVKLVKLKRRGRTFQRNCGANSAHGELLLFIDSDEVLHPMLVEECVNRFLYKKFDALFVVTADVGFGYFGRSRLIGNYINMLRDEIYLPNSALRFVTRKVFQTIGGMEEGLLVGEDVIFALKCLKHKFRVGRCKYAILHYAAEGLKNIFLKKYAYGKTYKRFKKEFKRFYLASPSKWYFQVGFFYLQNIFKFKKLGRYIPGFLIVKLTEMLGLILGSGIKTYFL